MQSIYLQLPHDNDIIYNNNNSNNTLPKYNITFGDWPRFRNWAIQTNPHV